MLTEAEKKWLEERKARLAKGSSTSASDYFCKWCYRCNWQCVAWYKDREMCPAHLGCDFQDAAEFEALVAAKLTGLNAAELPCYPNFLCPFSAKHIGSCKACYLKHARLAVEAEMG